MGQERQESFSFNEVSTNGKGIEVASQNFEGYDKTKINYYLFKPDSHAIAKLIFFHGGGAHGKLGYLQLAQTLKDRYNVETIIVDIRGHGSSEGKRGDCPKVNSLNKDINSIIRIAREGSDLPVYLGGHSSGGGLVMNYSSWKKKEAVDGYFFISPEFGYKSDTDRENRVPFATVKVWKFVINGMTQGLLLRHSPVVFFNFPEKVIEKNPLILTSITVNMSLALTPKKPKKQAQKITEPIAIFIGNQDELFDPNKVIEYAGMPSLTNKKTTFKIIENQKHLSILNEIGDEIGNTIAQWVK